MTKEDFKEGKSFTMKTQQSPSTYKYDGKCLLEEFRTAGGELVMRQYIMNVDKLGRVMVKAYTFIMGTKIKKCLRYEDMLEYLEVNNHNEMK